MSNRRSSPPFPSSHLGYILKWRDDTPSGYILGGSIRLLSAEKPRVVESGVPQALGLVLSGGLPARAQQKEKPKGKPKSASSAAAHTGKHHVLKATKDTVQWGWLDPNEKPKLTVNSGDTVSIETMYHALDQIKPNLPMDEIVRLRLANPGGGPHSVTGPIYVNGAEPGDTMEIRILKIVPKPDGFNFHLPGRSSPPSGCSPLSSPRASCATTSWIRPRCRPNSSRES